MRCVMKTPESVRAWAVITVRYGRGPSVGGRCGVPRALSWPGCWAPAGACCGAGRPCARPEPATAEMARSARANGRRVIVSVLRWRDRRATIWTSGRYVRAAGYVAGAAEKPLDPRAGGRAALQAEPSGPADRRAAFH